MVSVLLLFSFFLSGFDQSSVGVQPGFRTSGSFSIRGLQELGYVCLPHSPC